MFKNNTTPFSLVHVLMLRTWRQSAGIGDTRALYVGNEEDKFESGTDEDNNGVSIHLRHDLHDNCTAVIEPGTVM